MRVRYATAIDTPDFAAALERDANATLGISWSFGQRDTAENLIKDMKLSANSDKAALSRHCRRLFRLSQAASSAGSSRLAL